MNGRTYKGFIIPVLIIITLLILTIVVVYFFYPKSSRLVNTKIPTTSPSATPSATPYPTAGWKTYTSDKYKFSFKYPNTWGKGYECSMDSLKDTLRFGENLLKYPGSDCGTANIPSTVMLYFESVYNPYPGFLVKEEKDMKIGGKNAKYFLYKIIDRQTTSGPSEFVQVSIRLKDNLFLIGEIYDMQNKIFFDQILLTFKFIE